MNLRSFHPLATQWISSLLDARFDQMSLESEPSLKHLPHSLSSWTLFLRRPFEWQANSSELVWSTQEVSYSESNLDSASNHFKQFQVCPKERNEMERSSFTFRWAQKRIMFLVRDAKGALPKVESASPDSCQPGLGFPVVCPLLPFLGGGFPC